MSLLQLFIQAIKGEPPPPPTTQDGTIAMSVFPVTSCAMTVQALGTVEMSALAVGSVDVQVVPLNPG